MFKMVFTWILNHEDHHLARIRKIDKDFAEKHELKIF